MAAERGSQLFDYRYMARYRSCRWVTRNPQPLLIRATGGQHGGSSYLTEHGRALVRL